MIQDLDKTLENLLNDAAAPADVRAAEVRFQTPDKTFAPGQNTAALNLFLYDLKENRELRDPVPIVEKQGNVYVSRRPPLRVDCHYMVTAWADPTKTGEDKIKDEHQLLSNACLWLSRFTTIPSSYFAGSLAGPPAQPFPPPTLVAQMNGNKNLGEFWSALGVSPKPLFSLVVTIAMPFGVQLPFGPPVVTKETRLQQIQPAGAFEDVFEIGGTVRATGSLAPIPNASVILLGTGRMATSAADGRFRLDKLSAGNYTLRVAAIGFTTLDKAITVPGAALNSYDVNLSP